MCKQAGEASISRSEKIVTGLAATVLVVGFVTGVFVRPVNMSTHESTLSAHMQAPQVHHRG